jgi:RecA/RadA recombinase
VVELYGPEGAGKTAVALKLLKSAQAADMLVAWVATDVPPSPESLAWIGVDLERLAIARQTWATPGLELAQLLLEAGVDQVAIDSVACLLGPDPEASLAAVLNQGLPALSGAAERTGGRVVLVNQERLAGGRGHIPLPAGFCPAMTRLVQTRIRLEQGEGLYRAGVLLGHRVRFTIERDVGNREAWGRSGSFRLYWQGGQFRSTREQERGGTNAG